jgi:hypothetical protein
MINRGIIIMETKQRLEIIRQECKFRRDLKNIQFTHYFSNQFMEKYTQFFCIEDFFKQLGVTDKASLNEISKESWEQLVQMTTIFSSWQEMLDKAGEDYSLQNFY